MEVRRTQSKRLREWEEREKRPGIKKDSPEPPKAVLITLPVRRATGVKIAARDCGNIATL
jgi:hypothetical protein